MTRRPRKAAGKRPAKSRRTRAKPAPRWRTAAKAAKPSRPDPLDAMIAAESRALGLPIAKGWMPAVRSNLAVTLRHAAQVAAFELADEAEPAPVFRA
jgi:hypothetical protein